MGDPAPAAAGARTHATPSRCASQPASHALGPADQREVVDCTAPSTAGSPMTCAPWRTTSSRTPGQPPPPSSSAARRRACHSGTPSRSDTQRHRVVGEPDRARRSVVGHDRDRVRGIRPIPARSRRAATSRATGRDHRTVTSSRVRRGTRRPIEAGGPARAGHRRSSERHRDPATAGDTPADSARHRRRTATQTIPPGFSAVLAVGRRRASHAASQPEASAWSAAGPRKPRPTNDRDHHRPANVVEQLPAGSAVPAVEIDAVQRVTQRTRHSGPCRHLLSGMAGIDSRPVRCTVPEARCRIRCHADGPGVRRWARGYGACRRIPPDLR